MALLQSLGVKSGIARQEFEKLVEDVKGHALTLNLLGSYLRDAHAGDIRKRDLVKLEEADAEDQGGHAFRVMDAYVKWFESDGSEEEQSRGWRVLAAARLVRPARHGRLPRRLAESASHPRPDRAARRDERGRSGTSASRGWKPRSCSR